MLELRQLYSKAQELPNTGVVSLFCLTGIYKEHHAPYWLLVTRKKVSSTDQGWIFYNFLRLLFYIFPFVIEFGLVVSSNSF